jgi:hypothetical protein
MKSDVLGTGIQATSAVLDGRAIAGWLSLAGPLLVFIGLAIEIIDRRRVGKGADEITTRAGYVAWTLIFGGAVMMVVAVEI